MYDMPVGVGEGGEARQKSFDTRWESDILRRSPDARWRLETCFTRLSEGGVWNESARGEGGYFISGPEPDGVGADWRCGA